MQCFTIAINLCHATIRTIWVKTVSSGLILIEHFQHNAHFWPKKKSAYEIVEKHCKNYGFGNMNLFLEGKNGSKMSFFFHSKKRRKSIKKHVKNVVIFLWGSPFFDFFFAKNGFSWKWAFRLDGSSIFWEPGLVFALFFMPFLECFLGVLFFCYARTTSSLICKLQYFGSKKWGTSIKKIQF